MRRVLSGMTAVAALLAGCGGGGGSGQSAQGSAIQPAAMVGVYDVDYGQFQGVYTFLENGDFYGMHFITTLLVGHPSGVLAMAPTLNAPEAITWANFVDDPKRWGTFEQDPQFGRSFEGDSLAVGLKSPMGSFHAVTRGQRPYASGSAKTLYGDPLPITSLAGSYSGYLRAVGFVHPMENLGSFTIDAGGHVSTHAAGCDFSGTMSQHGSTGIFDVQMQSSGAGCNYAGTLKGIVTPLDVINGVPRLGFQLDNRPDLKAAVFIVLKNGASLM